MSAPFQTLLPRGASQQSILLRAQVQASMPLANQSIAPSAAGLVLKYFRVGDATMPEGGVSIAPTSIAGVSVAYTAGAVAPIADGYVRVDVPDAAWAKAVGVSRVLITAQATGVIFTGAVVELADTNIPFPAAPTPQSY